VRNWERALWELSRAEQDTGLAERMDELKMPVMIIAGDDDRVIPTEQSINLAKQIPGAQLAVLPICGHVPQDEYPEAFLSAMQPFLKQLEVR
jgi:pimeloyl-ACP methyl ester carboxylesterase